MPRPATRQEQKALTREALKRAARRSFARRGFQATQISDIAREAKLAQGTMYVHFRSKEAVLDELLDELDEALVRALDGAWLAGAEADGGLPAHVRCVALACLEVWSSHADLLRAFAERASLGLDLARIRAGVSPTAGTWLRAKLEETAAAFGASIPHPELVAQAVLGIWMRVGLASLYEESLSRTELAELLGTLTIGALSAVAPELAAGTRAPAPRPRGHGRRGQPKRGAP